MFCVWYIIDVLVLFIEVRVFDEEECDGSSDDYIEEEGKSYNFE